jgi:hypothetical protein
MILRAGCGEIVKTLSLASDGKPSEASEILILALVEGTLGIAFHW